ncbi:MAG: hypothetical protein DRJ33_07435 [Candidatus Methanomethylicota archaeon]|uniref:Uncharacterized protein n=1 Tax=Thermoproteota archaeon TaxID=2056631 RepID=A0A497ETD1_9CREN|nr:MAG: hypothetical protein DRJ33_07435 [Candidatus Verstraetearchaeota archaeon]
MSIYYSRDAMTEWIDKSKIASSELSKLGLGEKEKLHEESRYVLLTERTLLDLIMGMRDVLREGAAALLYHAFKKAAIRRFSSLLEDLKKFRMKELKVEEYALKAGDYKTILNEVVELYKFEGYAQDVQIKLDKEKESILLTYKGSLAHRLIKLCEKEKLMPPTEEVLSLVKGCVAGTFSALVGEDIDVREARIEPSGDVVVALPKEIFAKVAERITA